jgi:hypothetical protein
MFFAKERNIDNATDIHSRLKEQTGEYSLRSGVSWE